MVAAERVAGRTAGRAAERAGGRTAERAPAAPAAWAGEAPSREQQHAHKKLAILKTAAQAFREGGYRQTSLNDIARRLNVTKPALYYYVRNKEDILLGCQHLGFEEFDKQLSQVIAAGLNGRETLRRVMVSYGEWITGEFGLCVAKLWNEPISTDTRVRRDTARAKFQHSVRRVVQRGIDDGSLRRCDVDAVVSAMFGTFNWMAYWYDPERARSTPAQMGQRFVDVFIEGIGPLPVKAARKPSPAAAPSPARKPERKPATAPSRRRTATRKATP